VTDLIDRRTGAGESSLYKDRVVNTVRSGATWPYVERRRGPRRHGDGSASDRRARLVSTLDAASVVSASEFARFDRAPDRHLGGYRRAVLAIDVFAAVIGAASASVVRFGATLHGGNAEYFWGVAVLPMLWVVGVAAGRAYESRFLGSSAEEYRRVFNAGLGLIAAISVVSYAFKAEFARGYVVTALPTCVVLALAGRVAARRRLRTLRARGRCLQNVLVAGHEWSVLDLVTELRANPDSGLNVIGACVPGGRGSRRMSEAGIPVVGDLDGVVGAVTKLQVDVLAVTTCVELGGPELRQLCWALENMDVDVVVAPALIEVTGPRLHIRPVAGLPLLHVEKPEFTGARRVVKGFFDRSVAAIALVVTAPLMVAIALAVRVTSPGPALFRQTRVGVRGEEFTMLKFRSMHVDAEARLAAIRDLNENSDGLLFKVRDDPRMTRVGRLLRRYSLDELPQLINVVKGDMSLVGPRPPLPSEVALYPDDVRRRLLVKPGVTGLWQVSGRSDLSWEDSVRLDLRYVENWSLFYDFAILFKTASAVLKGSGAY
jgi:exopolysaccharide biosynthesis polyprenyl glycosylphosphotransferase